MALLYSTDITHNEILDDAYPMGALIAALTFLLAFRANNSHSRWWEAYTCVTNMQSKFLDVGTSLAAFHLQALKYESKKPPAFGEHPDIDFVERQRIRVKELTLEELEEQLLRFEQVSTVRHFMGKIGLGGRVGIASSSHHHQRQQQPQQPPGTKKSKTKFKHLKVKNIGGRPTDSVILSRKTKGIWADGQHEPLFLEEAAHLLSLLSAVAFATLRNDVEGAESPIITFDRREPFPHVDPDDYKVTCAQPT
jgi:Bestrophin, RFP-TM, chloride channel